MSNTPDPTVHAVSATRDPNAIPPRDMPTKETVVLESQPKPARVACDLEGNLTVRAPAKLNLGLRVFPARPDGFHDLESWMAPLSWHDTIRIQPNEPFSLTIEGRSEGIPTDVEKNLVGRAALALARHGNVEPRGRITLHKVLPPGGGLGGGSSDAANVLVALNSAWGLDLEPATLCDLALTLGSDVPFFVEGKSALCRGRGELMSPLKSYYPLYAVLIVPPQGLATKPVYEAFDAGHRHPPRESTNWCGMASMTAEQLNAALVNDLEPPAFHIAPWLAGLRQHASRLTGQTAHMTGSGSTLFTLCGTAAHATQLVRKLSDDLPDGNFVSSARILRQT